MERKPARSLPGELCNLHKAEDIHADSLGTPKLGGSLAPSYTSKGSLSSPMARTSVRLGLEWRQRVVAETQEGQYLEAAAATLLRP